MSFLCFEPISVVVPRVCLEVRRFGKEAGKRKLISVAVPKVCLEVGRFGKEAGNRKPISVAVPRVCLEAGRFGKEAGNRLKNPSFNQHKINFSIILLISEVSKRSSSHVQIRFL